MIEINVIHFDLQDIHNMNEFNRLLKNKKINVKNLINITKSATLYHYDLWYWKEIGEDIRP